LRTSWLIVGICRESNQVRSTPAVGTEEAGGDATRSRRVSLQPAPAWRAGETPGMPPETITVVASGKPVKRNGSGIAARRLTRLPCCMR
jgi:hypothetical protein